MKRMITKTFALLLTVAMILSLGALPAFAAEATITTPLDFSTATDDVTHEMYTWEQQYKKLTLRNAALVVDAANAITMPREAL